MRRPAAGGGPGPGWARSRPGGQGHWQPPLDSVTETVTMVAARSPGLARPLIRVMTQAHGPAGKVLEVPVGILEPEGLDTAMVHS
jgi:hypothetical protein